MTRIKMSMGILVRGLFVAAGLMALAGYITFAAFVATIGALIGMPKY